MTLGIKKDKEFVAKFCDRHFVKMDNCCNMFYFREIGEPEWKALDDYVGDLPKIVKKSKLR